jgi:hypothetical protein
VDPPPAEKAAEDQVTEEATAKEEEGAVASAAPPQPCEEPPQDSHLTDSFDASSEFTSSLKLDISVISGKTAEDEADEVVRHGDESGDDDGSEFAGQVPTLIDIDLGTGSEIAATS